MRRRIDAAAATICRLNLKRFLQERKPGRRTSRHRLEAYLDQVLGFSARVDALPEGREFPKHLGAEIGFLGILHTWGQNMLLHPHVQCTIPADFPPIAPAGYAASRLRHLACGDGVYSHRKAVIGSTREARCAGRKPATAATPRRIEEETITAAGSFADTPNSMPVTSLPPANATGTAMAMPIEISRSASPKIMRSTPLREAPKAIRTPISAVRRFTAYDWMPYSPTAASTNASTLKTDASSAIMRSRTSASFVRCSSVSVRSE